MQTDREGLLSFVLPWDSGSIRRDNITRCAWVLLGDIISKQRQNEPIANAAPQTRHSHCWCTSEDIFPNQLLSFSRFYKERFPLVLTRSPLMDVDTSLLPHWRKWMAKPFSLALEIKTLPRTRWMGSGVYFLPHSTQREAEQTITR